MSRAATGSSRALWWLLTFACGITVVSSMGLTVWLGLQPCHLCVWQRLLLLILTALFAMAAWLSSRSGALWPVVLSLPVSTSGIAAAAYQSWLQIQPPNTLSCTAGDPGVIEWLVESLGQIAPGLFLATGSCENAELWILGLSLANWALVLQAAVFVLATWGLLSRRRPLVCSDIKRAGPISNTISAGKAPQATAGSCEGSRQ